MWRGWMRKEQELDLENGCSDLLGADVPAGQRASAILILVMPRIVAQPPLWAPGCNTSVLFCRRPSHMRLSCIVFVFVCFVVYCICAPSSIVCGSATDGGRARGKTGKSDQRKKKVEIRFLIAIVSFNVTVPFWSTKKYFASKHK